MDKEAMMEQYFSGRMAKSLSQIERKIDKLEQLRNVMSEALESSKNVENSASVPSSSKDL
jgi:tetrahydromethanopterin S-methyltransferase subunit B